jgi:hypothetical protein
MQVGDLRESFLSETVLHSNITVKGKSKTPLMSHKQVVYTKQLKQRTNTHKHLVDFCRICLASPQSLCEVHTDSFLMVIVCH